jgi:hypothetical protein
MFAGILDVVDVLKNAILRHGDTSAEGRRIVYDTARRALSNVANRSDSLSPVFAQRQRDVLEEAIARLESEYDQVASLSVKFEEVRDSEIDIWESPSVEPTPAFERMGPFEAPISELKFTAPSIDTLESVEAVTAKKETAARAEVPTFDAASERPSSKSAWDWALSVSQQALAAAAEKAANYRKLKLESLLSKPAAEPEPADERPVDSANTDQRSTDQIEREAAAETPRHFMPEKADELPSLLPLERAWSSNPEQTARAGSGFARAQLTADDTLLANIRQQLASGLVPLDGAWVTSAERNANLAERETRAKRLALEAVLAISATAACAAVLGLLLLAIAY